MGSYEKIVETLRRCAKEIDCDGCPYYHEDGYWCDQKSIATDAADEIEALVKINDRFRELLDHRNKDVAELQRKVDELTSQLPKRGEWIRVQEVDIPGEIHPVAFKCMCSMCRNEYLFPKIPRYCPDCGSMNTAKTEVQDGSSR